MNLTYICVTGVKYESENEKDLKDLQDFPPPDPDHYPPGGEFTTRNISDKKNAAINGVKATKTRHHTAVILLQCFSVCGCPLVLCYYFLDMYIGSNFTN